MSRSKEDIARIAANIAGLTLPPQRLEEIAAEVARLDEALQTAQPRLKRDDEPATYFSVLRGTTS